MTEEQLADVLVYKQNQKDLSGNLIFNGLNSITDPCHCREVNSRISVVLNFGISELKCEKPNVTRLSEVLYQLQPLSNLAGKDEGIDNFMQNIWAYSIKTGNSDLISKIVRMYPFELDLMIDKITNSDFKESEMLFACENFSQLASIITLPEIFRHVTLRFAQISLNLDQEAQVLLNGLIKFLKSNTSKSKFLYLYPPELRSVATILNEAVHAEDQVLLNLINSIKAESQMNFVILVTHFPLFKHLQ